MTEETNVENFDDGLTRVAGVGADKRHHSKKIQEWHNLIVKGLNNGLTHTIDDGRRDDIVWVRRRLELWESFGRCVMNLENNQDYSSPEKELKEVAELGFKNTNRLEKKQND